ncbi:ABC transporter substrate-binding protein [Ornithinimicrobium pekingense]|uniref:ABC transporter substrate-binding protein n=1 Tax=Ornithinimicrobium pekingense TaxID=384677 RepID=A0ABQ2F5A1_9MICO|nr:ABC transporter substrate-binding protein [Ornithinimicrobium pekingense]GGK60387.1 ABC transporter substrate-binding protein [Ornithinimicrobium pekingense]
MRITTTARLVTALAGTSLALTACGSDPVELDEPGAEGSTATSAGSVLDRLDEAEVDRIREMVPQEYADAGEITAVNSGSFPPYMIVQEDGTVEGASAELADAVGEVWGIEVNHVTADGLSSILTGMSSGRFDFAFGPVGDFKERQAENDFVDYVQEFVVFAVEQGNPEGIEGLDTTCGLKIAVQAGGSAERVIKEQSQSCEDGGEAPVEVMSFKDQPQSILSVRSGRADAFFSSQAPLTYFVEQSEGELELAGTGQQNGFDTLYQGAVVAKDSDLGPLLQETLAALFEAGVYDDVMTEWNLSDNMIDEPGMNLGVS